MTETPTPTAPAEPTTCGFPGCDRPAERAVGPGRPPKYCDNEEHNAQTAFRARQGARGRAASEPDDMGRPVSMAQATASHSAERIAGLIEQLRGELDRHAEAVRIAGDTSAAEAQIETVMTEAAKKVSDAEAARAAEH